ncbi:MAG: hypothetical protein ACP5RF_01505 [Candidatus Micrarchaeia archaeon]
MIANRNREDLPSERHKRIEETVFEILKLENELYPKLHYQFTNAVKKFPDALKMAFRGEANNKVQQEEQIKAIYHDLLNRFKSIDEVGASLFYAQSTSIDRIKAIYNIDATELYKKFDLVIFGESLLIHLDQPLLFIPDAKSINSNKKVAKELTDKIISSIESSSLNVSQKTG